MMMTLIGKNEPHKGGTGHGDCSVPKTFGNRGGSTWVGGEERALKLI